MNATPSAPPLVSVVLPTHDRPALLDEAVRSVAAQTLQDWELVVVDDASDQAVDPARWPDLNNRLRLLRNQTSLGGAESKARGTRLAEGPFVAFLDDDDLFEPDLLARATSALQAHPQLDVLFLGVRWFGRLAPLAREEQSESMRRLLRIAPPAANGDLLLFDERLFEGFLEAIPMAFQRPIVRRSALARIGLHRSDCLMWDSEWALRAALTSRCALLQRELYVQRVDGQEYHSRPDRERAQIASALEMTLRLRRAPPPGTSSHSLDLLRLAASRHAGSLAYFHALHGPLASSLAAWWASQKLQPGVASPRVALAALAHAARRRLRPEPVRP